MKDIEAGCNMKIREAIRSDIENITKIWKEMMDFHIERDGSFNIANNAPKEFAKFIKENLSSRDWSVFVSEHNEEVIGYVLAKIEKRPPVFKELDFCEIFDLAIKQEFRRKGIGESLLSKVFQWCSEKKIKRIEVKIAVSNEISTKFWRKMGFKPYVEILYINK